jgi:hypothetical protein
MKQEGLGGNSSNHRCDQSPGSQPCEICGASSVQKTRRVKARRTALCPSLFNLDVSCLANAAMKVEALESVTWELDRLIAAVRSAGLRARGVTFSQTDSEFRRQGWLIIKLRIRSYPRRMRVFLNCPRLHDDVDELGALCVGGGKQRTHHHVCRDLLSLIRLSSGLL